MRVFAIIVMVLLLLVFLAFGFFAVVGFAVRAQDPDIVEVGMLLLLQLYALQCAIISVIALAGVGVIAAVLARPLAPRTVAVPGPA